ncbi:hypothetical protein HKBW3S06_01068 [Candidatus Hakubella thermalkaliphila]|uniref:DUF5667 domain-containing protein n=1 Tax=Candidatus Hakubella thermalkaliphila TaxID=2754717 RepID=A0A6V8NR37_9ACTN|nr:DUF5667 domain-containing protein [Candidatus Hakubella thermalkaliphila]MBT9169971.1 hypothetical protein [Actinomycetota bacterium]GFP21840.1 hypothetical protein HKBW3S06_01068 [Candidatus Hakubella thermalkaliphila]
MKSKILVYLTIAFLLLWSIPVQAFAQDSVQEALPEPGITPQSILYFLNVLIEEIRLFLASNPVDKARLSLEFAQEKAAEVELLLKTSSDTKTYPFLTVLRKVAYYQEHG